MIPTVQTKPGRSLRSGSACASFLFSACLFTFAFPNLIFHKGIGPLAWVALCPLFALLPRLGTKKSAAAGVAWGALAYALSDYWLLTYHPVALILVCMYAAILVALLFPLMAAIPRIFPRTGYLAYPFLWLSYEFLRSRGFMGYPYGVLGYAFWRNPNMLGLASVGGVWLVSFAALCVNTLLARALTAAWNACGFMGRLKAAVIPTGIALAAAALFSIAGAALKTGYEPRGFFHVALVQPDYRERQRGIHDYRTIADRLIRLTEEARKGHPNLIVWHETAIVPPLGWHLRFHPNRDTLELVSRVDAYIRGLDVPLLFGNGRAEPKEKGTLARRNWNSAFLFKDGREVGRYDKMRLVPYSETFPLKKELPKVSALIESEVGDFWEKGQDFTVFHLAGVAFSAPICFEDSFGDHTRVFAASGADFLVVLTDDAWARSEVCQYQHLGQSALRAAELGIPIARAANTGATVLLGPDGIVHSELAPFTEGILRVDIPLPPQPYSGTLYRRIGDAVGWAGLAVSALWVAMALLQGIRKHSRQTAGHKQD
jgi:apolipoprotein N-acyltransferase